MLSVKINNILLNNCKVYKTINIIYFTIKSIFIWKALESSVNNSGSPSFNQKSNKSRIQFDRRLIYINGLSRRFHDTLEDSLSPRSWLGYKDLWPPLSDIFCCKSHIVRALQIVSPQECGKHYVSPRFHSWTRDIFSGEMFAFLCDNVINLSTFLTFSMGLFCYVDGKVERLDTWMVKRSLMKTAFPASYLLLCEHVFM